jgi:hypothetical protein
MAKTVSAAAISCSEITDGSIQNVNMVHPGEPAGSLSEKTILCRSEGDAS